MSNYKNFLSHNQDKLENFNSKNKLLIVDRGRLHQIFHASIFALAFKNRTASETKQNEKTIDGEVVDHKKDDL